MCSLCGNSSSRQVEMDQINTRGFRDSFKQSVSIHSSKIINTLKSVYGFSKLFSEASVLRVPV